MRKKVWCKACGYITYEGDFTECAACGAPARVFEPYDDRVSEGRRAWLDKHVHPIIVHAPQALGFLLLLLLAVYFVQVQFMKGGSLAAMLLPTILVMSVLLPITVFGGMLSGMIDGKIRFKKISTILLRRKIVLGTLFLLLSGGMLAVALLPGFAADKGLEILYFLLNLAAFVCSMILGLWGTSLTPAIMRGGMPKKHSAAEPVKTE